MKVLNLLFSYTLACLVMLNAVVAQAQNNDTLLHRENDSLRPFIPVKFSKDLTRLTPDFYKVRYKEENLLTKVTDNFGNGFDSLYGTRNLRTILHGVAYRGGANNFYHQTNKRHNHNPLPNDGIKNLCQEGFSATIYLYRENFESAPKMDSCDCIAGGQNDIQYYQFDYANPAHIYEALKLVHQSATNDSIGPIYLHCWNGWHASGLLSALSLRQFCGMDKWEAINYWDLGTDGANNSPRYQPIREMIKNFEPYEDLMITDELGQQICPPMPKFIDSSELYVDIEHLVYVPESIPEGFSIVLHNVQFAAGMSSFVQPETNIDLRNLLTALRTHEDIKIEIAGYTDNSGSLQANIDISRQRAKFIYDFLIAKGIEKERLSFNGYGPQKPLYSNRYAATREGNRRIEIKITEKRKEDFSKLIEENDEVVGDNQSDWHFSALFEDGAALIYNQPLVIPSVTFPPNEVALQTGAEDDLKRLANVFKTHPQLKAEIAGHTDKSGLEELNLMLSEQRAAAVCQFLIDHGVAPAQLISKGYGSAKPIASNKFQYGKEQNRRIEVIFHGQ